MRRAIVLVLSSVVLLGGCRNAPTQLPLSAIATTREAATAERKDLVGAKFEFELARTVRADKDEAKAYKFRRTTRADVMRMARAFGVVGEVRSSDWGWEVVGDDPLRGSLQLGYDGEFNGHGDSRVVYPTESCPDVVHGDLRASGSCGAPATTSTTAAPRLIASVPDARRTAVVAVQLAGVDISEATISTHAEGSHVGVVFTPSIARELAGHDYATEISVDADGRIGFFGGYLMNRETVGTYKLATPRRALNRLAASGSRYEGTTEDIMRSQGPITLTRVGVGLTMVTTDKNRRRWLVPAYIFDSAPIDGGPPGIVVAPAAHNRYLPPGQ